MDVVPDWVFIMEKSARNRTLNMSAEEEREYLERTVRVDAPATAEDILDRTICGNCLEVMPLLPEGFVDLAIADPPYNADMDFGGTKFRRMDDDAYEKYTEKWMERMLPLLKPDASVYVCCDWRSSGAVERVLKKRLVVRSRITWQREKGRGALKNWKNGMEDIWFATVSDDYTFNVGDVKMRRRVIAPYRTGGKPRDWEETPEGNFRDTYPSNFMDDISVPYWSMPENTAHPAQKPEKLLAKLILAGTDRGGVVFDPFLGSGSTSVAAKKLGRRYVGIEMNGRYCAWAEKRLEAAETDRTIQGYEDGVFWERNTANIIAKFRKKNS